MPSTPTLCLMLWITLAASGATGQDAVSMPTVTRAEAVLLEEAESFATTNLTAAIERLAGVDRRDASPAVDYVLGGLYYRARRFAEAREAYAEAVRKQPEFAAARIAMAQAFLQLGQIDEAASLCRALIANGTGNASVFLLAGHALLEQGSLIAAETAYRHCLLLDPETPGAKMGLAKTLLEEKRHEEALVLVLDLLRTRPDQPELWRLRVQLHLALDDPDRALEAIEAAALLDAAEADLLKLLGDLYANRGQPADAYRAYRLATEQAPEQDAEMLLGAAEGLLLLGDTVQARGFLARAAAAGDGDDPRRKARRLRLEARCALLEGDRGTAEQLGLEILRIDPLDGETLLALGELCRSDGELGRAVMAFERAARIAGFEGRALVRQARAEVERERYARAVTLLEQAVVFDGRPHITRYLDQVRRLAQLQD